ncbi:MAG: class IV adenylate cyclase [Patescibacteria group bacterium]
MEEIEVKFLNINVSEVEKKLVDVGAVKKGEYFQRWKAFDYPDWRLDKRGAWLRLRDEGNGTVTLTLKQRLGVISDDGLVNDDGMEEVEVRVDSFENSAELLLKIGFIEKHYAEKKRICWEKEAVEFDIDTYPELEPYLEIEASSWEKIDEAISWLGLNGDDRKIFSANQVYALKGIEVSDHTRIAFDGLVKR